MHLSHRFLVATLTPLALLFAVSCGKDEKETDNPGKDPEEEKTETPVIRIADAVDGTVTVAAKGDTYIIPVTVEHPQDGAVLTAAVSGEAPAWLQLGTPTAEGVPVTLTDNFSAARSTTLELSYPKATSVSFTLTQAQWEFPEFSIAISKLGPFGATFTVQRKSAYNGGYFFEVLDKTTFDKLIAGDTHAVGSREWGEAVYQSDVEYLNRLAQQHGHPLSHLFGMLSSMYSTEAEVTMPYSGLSNETDYIFLVYGMDATDAATRRTPICFYSFRTVYSSDSGLQFSGKVTDLTETYATITVTPSDANEYWYMNWVSEIQLKTMDLGTVMQNSINSAKSLLGKYTASQILCHGTESLQATDLMPGTEYTVVAWGMNLEMEATTPPVAVFTFRTEEYALSDDCTFQIDVLEIEDMDVRVRVTPTNPDTRYYVAFVAKSVMDGYSDEQAAQRIINMEAQRISQGYYDVPDLSWANLPGLEPGVRTIWGRRDEGWTFFPSHDYRIYVFGIDYFGIRSTVVNAIDVTTAEAGESNNHFTVDIVSNTWQGLDFTVTPEIDDDYWMTFLAEKEDIETYFRNADGTLKEKELFAWVEEYYEDEINYHAYRGTRTLHEHVTPATDYILLVFGYSGAPTTAMYEWTISVPEPPLGKSTADYTYTYELFRGEDLSALNPTLFPLKDFEGDCVMVTNFTVTDNAAHWYFGCWPPVENFAEQGGQYYLMTLDMNPDVAGSAMQDKKFFRNRPWWYGSSQGYTWVDKEGDIVNHWPWSLSGWAEDADGNYGPWHYELFIPVPVPKGQETGKYEVGYTEAYDFWSNPSGVGSMQIFRVSDGKEILTPIKR